MKQMEAEKLDNEMLKGFGILIVLLCVSVLVQNDQNSEQMNNSKLTSGSRKDEPGFYSKLTSGSRKDEPGFYTNMAGQLSAYSWGEIVAFAIAQILSSLCLLNSKRWFKIVAKAWIALQAFTVTGTVIFLWKLPTGDTPDGRQRQQTEEQFSRHLFAVLKINACLTVFLILVLIEFIVHPETTKQKCTANSSSVNEYEDC